MKFRPLTTLALIMAIAQPAAAYTVKGSVECPDLVREDENEKFRLANMWWVLGYISGRNYERDTNTAKGLESEYIYDQVLSYCRTHPDNDMDDASMDLYDVLK